MTINASSIVTDIVCPCGFTVIIDQPDRQIGVSRQIRREWFAHLRDEHPPEYAKVSPAFGVQWAIDVAEAIARRERNAAKFKLADKKAKKGG